jgi:predicted transcriptional regulator
MADKLPQFDLYYLARVFHGVDLKLDDPTKLTDRGRSILLYLAAAHPMDRPMLARQKLSPGEIADLYTFDMNDEPPGEPLDMPRYQFVAADNLHKLPPLHWLVPGEIVEAGLCVLYGESGVGKSFVALDYALRLSTAGIPVVYAPTEGEGGYRQRVDAWKTHYRHSSAGSLVFLFGGLLLHDDASMKAVMPGFEQIKPKLLIIDTLAMGMAGLDENSARDVGKFMHLCRGLMRTLNTAIMLVHHTSKAGVVERGSTAIRGNADTMIKLSDADDLVLMECAKTKDAEPFPPRYLALLPVKESMVVIPGDQMMREGSELSPKQRRILDILALETNREGVSIRDLADIAGLSLGAVTRALSNLLYKKLVHKPNGTYSITEAGMKALERDPLDLSRPDHSPNFSPSKAARDPGDPGDPGDSDEDDDEGLAGSPGSGGSGGSGGSAPLFPLPPEKRPPNQYDRNA